MLRVIGLMSGTSLDGVDAAWLETDGVTIHRFGPSLTLPYEPTLRADEPLDSGQPPGRAEALSQLDGTLDQLWTHGRRC